MSVYTITPDPVISAPINLCLCIVVFVLGMLDVGMDVIAEWFSHDELESPAESGHRSDEGIKKTCKQMFVSFWTVGLS